MSNNENQKITFLDKVIKLVDGSTIMGRLILNPDRDNENFIYVIKPIELGVSSSSDNWFWRDWNPFSKSVIQTIPVTNLICISDPRLDVLSEYIEHVLNNSETDDENNSETDDETIFNEFVGSNLIH